MRTVTLDILDDKAFNLLRDLEDLKIIKIQDQNIDGNKNPSVNFIAKYKGKMSKQLPGEIDRQLDELRNEWD